jgi:hypothetical protein
MNKRFTSLNKLKKRAAPFPRRESQRGRKGETNLSLNHTIKEAWCSVHQQKYYSFHRFNHTQGKELTEEVFTRSISIFPAIRNKRLAICSSNGLSATKVVPAFQQDI